MIRNMPVILGLPALLAIGCANGGGPKSPVEAQLATQRERVEELESALDQRDRAVADKDRQLARMRDELESARTPAVAAAPPSFADEGLLPAKAQAGQCFAKVFVPATYETRTERVLERETASRIEVIPARYQTVEEQVLVREASERLEKVPATYETVEERVLVKPAHTVWKKGRGPIERVDHSTGEIMCLVEIPDQYETVRRRVQKTPPTTRRVAIPAKYETVKVRKLVEPPREKRVEIPAKYATVTKRTLVTDGQMAWRPVLCETNLTRDTVRSIQAALDGAGHSPGPVDGVLGQQTLVAVHSYQKAKGLSTGGITIATLDSLGVQVGR